MANRTILDTKLIDLIPFHLSTNEEVKAICEALDAPLKALFTELEKIRIYKNVDTNNELLTRHLATDYQIEQLEYNLAGGLDEKRELVKNAVYLHQIKGTRRAIERVLEILKLSAIITEWWEEGGSGDPYHFAINITMNDSAINPTTTAYLEAMINKYKPVRAWGTFTYSVTISGTLSVAAAIASTRFSILQTAEAM